MNPFSPPKRSPRRPLGSIKDIPLLPEPFIGSPAARPRLASFERFSSSSPQVNLPSGWQAYIHPKGWLYYANLQRRMVTDYNIKYQLDQSEFEAALSVDNGVWNDVPEGFELWIDYGAKSPERWYICHTKRTISDKFPESTPQQRRQHQKSLTVDSATLRGPPGGGGLGLTGLDPTAEAKSTATDAGTAEAAMGRSSADLTETENAMFAMPSNAADQVPGMENTSWRQQEVDIEEQLKQESRYWEYISDHPCHHPLAPQAEEDAIASLSYYTQDRMLNPEESFSPYSETLSKDLLELLKGMVEDDKTFGTERNAYIKRLYVASLLERVASERLRLHYGQNDARNHIKRQLHQHSRTLLAEHITPSLLIIDLFIVFVCFGAPYTYLRRINEFFMPGYGRTETITERWSEFVSDNVQDWTNTNLVATVLISAAVVVLGFPDLESVPRCFGTLSTLFAIASIVCGLLNVWQHQHESKTTLKLTVITDFFAQAETWTHSDKLLSILLALPMVLLMWATLSFAVMIVSFTWYAEVTPDKVTTAEFVVPWIVTGFTAVLTFTVLVSVLFFWRAWQPTRPHRGLKQKRD